MDRIAETINAVGPNAPYVAPMIVGVHLASRNDLPEASAWHIALTRTDHGWEPLLDVYVMSHGFNAMDVMALWAARLGGEIETEKRRSDGRTLLSVRVRHLGVLVDVHTISDAVPEPAEMGLPPAPHPAEALGQAPAAAPPPEPYETRPDGRMAPPAAAGPVNGTAVR